SNDGLPLVRIGACPHRVEIVEREPARPEFLIMASDAVSIEKRPGLGGNRRSLRVKQDPSDDPAAEEEREYPRVHRPRASPRHITRLQPPGHIPASRQPDCILARQL